MFAGVLLHMIKTPFPVDDTMHLGARDQRFICIMNDPVIPLAYIADNRFIQHAVISRLPAAFRIESRIVQNDFKTLFPFCT